MTPEEVARAFVDAINSGSVETLSELMTPNHVFIDSDGSEIAGQDSMREGWANYLAMVPDYKIAVERTLVRGDIVVFLGIASGTFVQEGTLKPENHWTVPAAWRAVVENDKIAVWQLYVNPEPMRQIMERMSDKS
jgi:ketosteroid isomerase-like protein